MKLNLATWDRIARVVLGLAVLSLAFVGPRSVLGLLGLVPLLTGLAGRCPLYTLFGVSTCPLDPPRRRGPAPT